MNQYSTELKKTVEAVNKGGVILYPTDTIWGLGCSATNEAAFLNIYKIKNRPPSKSFIILVEDVECLQYHVGTLTTNVLEYIAALKRPTTIIYPKSQNLPKAILAEDGSIGIRLVKMQFCEDLIKGIDAPLVSTSANISGMPSPQKFEDISKKIQQEVDFIVNDKLFLSGNSPASKILKLNEDESFTIIR